MKYPLYSYDDAALETELVQCHEKAIKYCQACGKKFLPHGRNAKRMKFCSRQHYQQCSICGKVYDVDLNVGLNNVKKTCSKKCSNQLKISTMNNVLLDRYGYRWKD